MQVSNQLALSLFISEGAQMQTMSQAHPYPVLSQLAHVYEQQQQQQQQQPVKELNKYASLKAVGKAGNVLYS